MRWFAAHSAATEAHGVVRDYVARREGWEATGQEGDGAVCGVQQAPDGPSVPSRHARGLVQLQPRGVPQCESRVM